MTVAAKEPRTLGELVVTCKIAGKEMDIDDPSDEIVSGTIIGTEGGDTSEIVCFDLGNVMRYTSEKMEKEAPRSETFPSSCPVASFRDNSGGGYQFYPFGEMGPLVKILTGH